MEIISSIEKQHGGYYLIVFEDGGKAKVPVPLLRAFPLKVKSAVDLSVYFETHKKAAFKLAAGRAAYLLEKKDYTTKEMRYKLTFVGYPDEVVEELLQYMLERRFLDDGRYAEQYIKRKKSKYGINRIKKELMYKGIEKAITEEALEEQLEEDESLDLAVELVSKYIKTRMHLEPHKLYNNAVAMLARKGFDYSTAKEAYNSALSSLER
ncbi:MAG: regulatory protein RecX [Eubacteriales bacterium]|nr:regulatory protein RecX [Eubacteriales bacterium]